MSRHLGLDLGGTNIKVAIVEQVDDQFEVISTESVATKAAAGPSAVTDNLIRVGSKVIEGTSTLGLGVPGHFDRDTGEIILFPNLPGEWKGFPLRKRISAGLETPVWMVNDARAFTLAEGLIGGGRGSRIVACITLGTGVGGGIMIEGKLHRGAFGVAGELGHQTIIPDGPLCGCGNRGCMEALTKADVLSRLAGKDSASEVFEAARKGDPKATAAVDQIARYLGIGLANVVTLFGPDRIVVGGGIAEAGNLILDPIRQAVHSRVTLVPKEKIEIVPARFGRFAGAVGAALAGVFRS